MLRRIGRAAAGVLGLAGVLAMLTGCTAGPAPAPSPTPPPPSGDGVLRIGTLFTTSGGGAAGLTAAVYAAVRAIDEAGGVQGAPVEVINRDAGTAGDGTAEAAFADLVERGADVVIGPSSMELAGEVAPLAVRAGIPLVAPSATGARPDGTAGVFRTVPDAVVQATALGELLAEEGPRVALVRTAESAGEALAAGIADGLAAHDAELVADVIAGADPAADAQQVAGAEPDVVVVATASGGDATAALLDALAASGLGGEVLWITGGALVRYGDGTGPLDGAHGIQSGVSTEPAFLGQVRLEDPGARDLRFAANAYDAVVLAALAAVLAGDDGGASIAASLPAAAADGIPCHSFGECLDVLTTQSDIAYEGASGVLEFDETGDREAAGFARYRYDDANRPVLEEGPAG